MTLDKLGHRRHKMPQRTAEPVQSPDDERMSMADTGVRWAMWANPPISTVTGERPLLRAERTAGLARASAATMKGEQHERDPVAYAPPRRP